MNHETERLYTSPPPTNNMQGVAIMKDLKSMPYTNYTPLKPRIIRLGLAVLVLIFCLKYGWEYMLRAKVTSSEVLRIPMQMVYLVLPYSFGMTLLCCFERLIELFSCWAMPERLKECDDIRSGESSELN